MSKRASTPKGANDDRVRALHAQGMGWSQIGREIGIAPQQACKIGRRLGLALDPSEVRARMSEASKKAWADPEVRARMSEASKKAWADPEVRARMSEARKKAHGLDRLSPDERADYDLLKRNGYSRAEALLAIDRGDLLPPAAVAAE